jgi:Holliday junction resolvase RusA-like endonuclease
MVWPGRPITKKNSMQIVRNGARSAALPSNAFMTYQTDAGWHINRHKYIYISRPVVVKCLYYMPTKGKVDLLNLLAATCDILTHYGVLLDDNADIVKSHDGSRVLYDKDNPRAEITITEYTP